MSEAPRYPGTPRDVLEARWRAVEDGMADAEIDVLLVVARGAISQYGNLCYLSGYPLFISYGYALIFPRRPPELVLGKRDQIVARGYGLGDLLVDLDAGDITYGLTEYSVLAEAISARLRANDARRARVGVIGMRELMPIGDYEALKALEPDIDFVDAAGLLMTVKARKSERELELYRESVAIVDDGWATYLESVEAGRTEAELAARVEGAVRAHGVVHSIVQVLSGQMYTTPPSMRRLADHELVCCYVEVVGPYGFWVEKGGMFALGEVPDRALEVNAAADRASQAMVDLLRAGAVAGDVASAAADVAAAAECGLGIQPGHGVGIDHDAPLLATGEATVLEEGMVVTVHPHLHDDRYGAMWMDQYTVGANGATRHSQYERVLKEV